MLITTKRKIRKIACICLNLNKVKYFKQKMVCFEISYLIDSTVHSSARALFFFSIGNFFSDWKPYFIVSSYPVNLKIGCLSSFYFYYLLDTTPPDVFINNNPHPKSKTRQITFDLSCNENCRIYCSLYQEGSFAKYSKCYLPSTRFRLNDDTAYIFVVKAVDDVGNVGNNTFYRFRTGIFL